MFDCVIILDFYCNILRNILSYQSMVLAGFLIKEASNSGRTTRFGATTGKIFSQIHQLLAPVQQRPKRILQSAGKLFRAACILLHSQGASTFQEGQRGSVAVCR